MRIKIIFLWVSILFCQLSFARTDCIVITNPEHTDSTSKFEIQESGNYCLAEDLHSRMDFADHKAEPRLIHIWASDVTLDLQGHVLGRGKFFKEPGGSGIAISENLKNITIKNGAMQDFKVAIYRGVATLLDGKKRELKPRYDPITKTYRFEHDNIVISNISFVRNRIDMQFEEKE